MMPKKTFKISIFTKRNPSTCSQPHTGFVDKLQSVQLENQLKCSWAEVLQAGNVEKGQETERVSQLVHPRGRKAWGEVWLWSLQPLGVWSLSPGKDSPIQSNREGKGSLSSIRQWESGGIQSTWEFQAPPSRTKSDFFVTTPAWEIHSDLSVGGAMWQRPGPAEESDWYTQKSIWGALHSVDELWGESQKRAGQCGMGERIDLAQLKLTGSHPPPTCKTAGCSPSWKSALLWLLLGLMEQKTWTFGLVGTWVEAPTRGGQMCWKIGVPSWVDFIIFYFMPSYLVWRGEGTREPGIDVSRVSSVSAVLGRRGSVCPTLQTVGTNPNAGVFKPPWPGPGYPAVSRSVEKQRHLRCKTRGRSGFWAMEPPPMGLLGALPSRLQSDCWGPGRDSDWH